MGEYCVSCGKKMKAFTKTVCNNKLRHLKCHIEYESRTNWLAYPRRYNNDTGIENIDFKEKYKLWVDSLKDYL